MLFTLLLIVFLLIVLYFVLDASLMQRRPATNLSWAHLVDIDPPTRESRPIPYPMDAYNEDQPMLIKDENVFRV